MEQVKLCLSRFFNAWDERMYEFLSYILITEKFNGSLGPPSMFGLFVTFTGIIFNTHVCGLADKYKIIEIVTIAIIIQKLALLFSGVFVQYRWPKDT